MIPLVEDILTEVIETRLKWLKTNVDIVDRIFSQMSVTSRNRLKEYLGKNNIKVMRGYPIDRTQLPAFVIMLGGESEMSQTLGGYLGENDETFDIQNQVETQRILNHDGMYVVKTSKRPLFCVNSITYDGITYDVEYEILDEQRGIVMLDFPVDLVQESSVTIDYVYKESGTETYGTYYQSQYRVESWTNNGDLTVTLYHLLKWIFLSSRDEMVEKGLIVQSLGGTDFEPAPEYFPEFVYRRALTFECTVENSYDVEFKYINSIDVNGKLVEGEYRLGEGD